MNSALYVGATGMKSLSEGMNVVSNNIANVSTVGFKEQVITFSDLMYNSQGNLGDSWNTTDDSIVALGQVGSGVQVDAIRTSFNQGAFESSNELTDLAIAGKGFFQVTGLEGETLYSRAGNFRFDESGFLSLPGGQVLNGHPIDETGVLTSLVPIQLNKFDTLAGSGTTQMDLGFNLGNVPDSTESATDSFFSLAQNYDPTATVPIGNPGYSQTLQIYNAAGEKEDLTIYFDGTPSDPPEQVIEFLIASNATTDDASSQALMTGTLTFDSQGELIDMSAFTPTDAANTQDLNTWVPATLVNGVPQFTFNEQSIGINMGISGAEAWTNAPATAAAVGTDKALLSSMGANATVSADASTAFSGSNSQYLGEQDGYGEGQLTQLDITENGRIVGRYTNGQDADLFEIPIARFTSEDGLHREGGNLFSSTPAAGAMDLGVAGTENYGSIQAGTLEMSNVDMAKEMVNMIVTQRGFQSNSKVVTTADEMLKKAMEIKRQ